MKKFHKSYFDIDIILSSAAELKYTSKLKAAIAKDFTNPSPDFVKHFGKQIYDGLFTAKVLEQFTTIVKRSIASHISDLISDRLKAFIREEESKQAQQTEAIQNFETQETNAIVTTNVDLEAFYIVKSILRNII